MVEIVEDIDVGIEVDYFVKLCLFEDQQFVEGVAKTTVTMFFVAVDELLRNGNGVAIFENIYSSCFHPITHFRFLFNEVGRKHGVERDGSTCLP